MTDPTVVVLADALRPVTRSVLFSGDKDGENWLAATAATIRAALADAGYVVVRAEDDKRLRAALRNVLESSALDADDLLWLDKECRAALAAKW